MKIPTEKKSGFFKVPINDHLKKNIKEYIEKYILKRYQKGKSKEYYFPVDATIPTPFTFVFGHTHRPVNNGNKDDAQINLAGDEYPILNTGGWLRNDGIKPNGENAGVLVINQNGAEWKSFVGELT